MSFPSISPKQSFPALESEILAYWKANNTFKKSIESRPEDNPYRFYDGPPFITGMPHYGSLLSSIVKDVVGRYWTMQGRRVDRTWGWDCHGLPIEEKVQKKLGLKSNKEIEENGVKKFIDECYNYTRDVSSEWNWYIDKIGRWVDMDRAYRTMDQDYMESVMWVFSELWKKWLIYEGKRVSLYSWKLWTPISNFEVAMDDTYQDVNDPAITVKFALEQSSEYIDTKEWGKFEYTPEGFLRYVLAVIKNEKWEYLMLKNIKHNHKWQCPGGKIDAGETAEQALSREVMEELGVDCTIGSKITEKRTLVDGTMWQGEYYEVVLSGTPTIQETHKHTKLEWVSLTSDESGYILQSETEKSDDQNFIRENFDLWNLATNRPNIDSVSILAWTTTPWTIPANMALAVGEKIDYVLVENAGLWYVVARSRLETVFKGKWEYTIIREFKGAELVGLSYVPPFPEYYHGKKWDKPHKVYASDFATDTDGTGIVHIAPEFGDVDFGLAKKYGIPVTEAMDEAGKYTAEIFDYEGTHYLDLENLEKWANKINTERMKANNTLFRLEGITHRVPFCPRSGTPLVQKAQASWFIDIQSQKDKLIEANEQINWFPEYLKEWRFKKGIESAPDWCISRTRFWWAPMPVWMGEDGEKMVVSSREEIFEANKPFGQLTKIIFVRHWESIKNTEGIIDGTDKLRFPLTEKWRKIAQETAEKLSKETISAIYSSPFARAQETAEIINSKHDLDIIFDDRLREVFLWNMDGKKRVEIQDHYTAEHDKYLSDWNHKIWWWDSVNDILERMKSFTQEVSKKHWWETIVIVSHADQIAIIKEYLTDKKAFASNIDLPKVGEPISIYYDQSTEKQLNLHKPYIDSIKLKSRATGNTLTRIPEVLDVWMDSGSMPYAQMHYPFENKEAMQASFPADFIAEYVGQIRAWFYVMHVLGVLLNPNNNPKPTPSFTNVITTGVVNGNDGRKMSKSFGNYPDPRMAIEKYGADPIRFYMLNSPLLSGGDMDFKEEGIMETIKGVMLPIWNTYSFFTTYANIDSWEADTTEVWFSRHAESTSNIANKMSDGFDNPELTEKGREQAKNAGKTLRDQGKNFDVILHTDRIRASDTAHIIGEEIGFSGEYIIEDGFAEQTAGEYANMTLTEIMEMHNLPKDTPHSELRKLYKNNSVENIEQFEARILGTYENVLAKYKWKRVLIVAHAGTPRPILHHYMGMEHSQAHYNTTIWNADPFRLMTTPIVNPLDSWVLSRLQVLIGQTHDAMEGYDISRGCRAIMDYMDELTNWYVRLSRRRFWESGMTADKKSAYQTLHTVLSELSKLLAPLMPFLSESIWKGLTDNHPFIKGDVTKWQGDLVSGNSEQNPPSPLSQGGMDVNSVHLQYITRPNRHLIANDLNRDMEICEHIVSLGLALRSRKNIRVRQPLASVTITRELDSYYQTIIRDELNVKEVKFEDPEKLAKKICKPDARKIGPKYGKDVQKVIVEAKNGNFVEKENGIIDVGGFILESGEYTMEYLPLEGTLDVEGGYGMVVALDTTITESLKLEWYARDIIRLIQDMRKEAGYAVIDRIQISISGEWTQPIVDQFGDMISSETLSTFGEITSPDVQKNESIDEQISLCIKVKKNS